MWILYVFSWGSGMVPTWLGCDQCVLPSGPFVSFVFVWLMCGSCVPLVQLMCSFYVTCPWLRHGPYMFLHGPGVAGLHVPSGVDPSVPVPSPCSAVDSEYPLGPPFKTPTPRLCSQTHSLDSGTSCHCHSFCGARASQGTCPLFLLVRRPRMWVPEQGLAAEMTTSPDVSPLSSCGGQR